MLLGEDARDLGGRDEAAVDEDLAQALRRRSLLLERELELLDGQRAVAEEERAERGPGMCCGFHLGRVIGTRSRDLSRGNGYIKRSPVTQWISSSEETPERTRRIPSSRRVVIPAATAAAKISSVDASIR